LQNDGTLNFMHFSEPLCRLGIGQLHDLQTWDANIILQKSCNHMSVSRVPSGGGELEGVLRAVLAIVAAYLLF